MSISTKAGDHKETSTGSGKRVSKASERIMIIGEADELCALLGVAKTFITDEEIRSSVHRIQNMLFVLTAELADPMKIKLKRSIEEKDLRFLETTGEYIEKSIPKIHFFIVYGEDTASAYLDYARAVARRLERHVVGAQDEVPVSDVVLKVLNRLSDTLYLLARLNDTRKRRTFVPVSYE